MGLMRKAIEDYGMIKSGDKICVGLSGGKDSIVTLISLASIRKFLPQKFELCSATVDLGFGTDYSPMQNLCDDMDVEYMIQPTDIGDVVFNIRKEKNPCSLCSKMRKGALHSAAISMGANKIALGHNNDDAIETFFLRLLYEGRIGCFSPVSFLDRTNLTQIRPLIYAGESDVLSALKRTPYKAITNVCPANGNTKRQQMRDMLEQLYKKDGDVKSRVFGALKRSHIDGW